MNSKIFSDNILKRNFLVILVLIVLIDLVSLLLWFDFRIRPNHLHNDEIKQEILNKISIVTFEDKDKLITYLDDLSNLYGAKFKLIDEDNNDIISFDEKNTDVYMFTEVINVVDTNYIVCCFLKNKSNMATSSLEVIGLQVLIVMLSMLIMFLATRRTILDPIQNIVDEIRAYKFGFKPTKKTINTELDLIQNEFVNLVESIDSEKNEQNRIIASISHDIKTPLTSIMGYSSLLNDENITIEEAKEYGIKINEKSIHIKNILSNFDEYLSGHNRLNLNLVNFLVKDIVKDINNDYKVELERKNIKFNASTKCGNEILSVDILKIKRVFSNIISNSIRYLPKDNGEINVMITRENDYIKFVISDNGCGIDDKIINNVFNPFFTTDNSRKISGLGLSICKEFVEMHNGNISCRNNNGLVVEFTLPVVEYSKKRNSKKNK